MQELIVNPNDKAYKLQEKLGLGGLWKDVDKCYTLIKEFEQLNSLEVRNELKDKLTRRNMQIKELKKRLNGKTFCPKCSQEFTVQL